MFFLFIVSVVGFIICTFYYGKAYRKRGAFDDSAQDVDNEKIEPLLSRYIGNKGERIVGVLGKYNLINDETVKKDGLCIVSDKAFYFMGGIFKRKSFITWKSGIQSRIPLDKLKEFRLNHVFPWYSAVYLLYLLIPIYCAIGKIKYSFEVESWLILGYFLAMFFLIIFVISSVISLFNVRGTTIEFAFDDQVFCFFIGSLGENELKKFYEAMSKVQGELLPNYEKDTPEIYQTQQIQRHQGNAVNNNSDMGGKISTLKELADLYEKNMISNEEYTRLKNEILGGK